VSSGARAVTPAVTAGQCVEVGTAPQSVAVRDSKDPDGPALVFSESEWDVFLGHLKDGRIALA
jgi:Domain of unknown function (DUF397)